MAISEAAKTRYQLVRFEYGVPGQMAHRNYTDQTSDVNYAGEIYTSLPTIDVKLDAMNGSLKERPTKIILTTDGSDEFLSKISSGEPVPRVQVTVREIQISETSSEERITVSGYCRRSVKNYESKPNRVMVEAVTAKGLLEAQMSLPCNPECENTWGESPCFISTLLTPSVNKANLTQPGTVDAVSGTVVTITTNLDYDNPSSVYWKGGYIDYDGVRIKIRDWSTLAPTQFLLVRQPPAGWLGATVQLTPGCTKSKLRCDEWGNIGQFAAFGYAIPDYNPILEEPPEE